MKKLTLLSLITLLSISTYSQSLYWEKTGNVGNTESDFIGTTDSKPVIIKSNNDTKMYISPSGNIGFSISSPKASLHIHNSNAICEDIIETNPDAGSLTEMTDSLLKPKPNLEPTTPNPKGISYSPSISFSYKNTILLTNSLTGNTINNGFKIEQESDMVTLKQQENSMFRIFSKNNTGIIIAPNGNITIGRANSHYSNLDYNLFVDGVLYSNVIKSPRVILENPAATNWNCILQINTSGDQTKGICINSPEEEEVFRVYGNGITYSKYLVSEQIKVDLEALNIQWYDHVFSPEYKLMSIQEVERFVRENHHLPDIPSEKEIKENGLNLAEMDALLLKKIEEMMLYIIELEKKINDFEMGKNK